MVTGYAYKGYFLANNASKCLKTCCIKGFKDLGLFFQPKLLHESFNALTAASGSPQVRYAALSTTPGNRKYLSLFEH
jgi:hypothetical protein